MSLIPSVRHPALFTAQFLFSAIFLATAASAGPGYLYVGEYDSTPTTQAHVSFPINAQAVSNLTADEHSLFEMSMSNQSGATGDIIEIGVTTDIGVNGDRNPHWFVFSWINGQGQGYDANSHFVSQIGSFWATPLTSYEGTSQSAAFQYSNGNWWLYLNGNAAGYFPGSEWSGAFTTSSVTEVFGEVYWDGTYYPSLNGTVSGYASSGGGSLSPGWAQSPYAISNASATGFTASGPPPSYWASATSGNWSSSGSWTAGVPNALGARAALSAATTAAVTVTLDAPVTLGTLQFGNSATANRGYTLSGSGSNMLTFNNFGSGATVTVTNGTHAINAPVVLADNLAVTTGGTNSWTLSFGTASSIGGGYSLTMSGTGGTLILSGSNTYTGATTVSAGLLMAGAVNALSASSAVTISGGTLDASGFANTVASLNVNGGGLNLGLGNRLTSEGSAALAGNLNVSGVGTLGNYQLCTYTSESGAFSSTTGLGPNYGLLYNTNGTELDALHKAQIGTITVSAVYPTVIVGGRTSLTVNVNNSAPASSDVLNFAASAGGSGYSLGTTGSLTATSNGNFTIANGFNSSSLAAGSYTGTITVTGTSSALVTAALNSGSTQTVTVNVLGHANPVFAVATGNNQSVFIGAGGVAANLSLTDSGTNLSPLDVNTLGSGLSGGTGTAVVLSGSSGTYTATLATGTAGLSQTQSFSLKVGDEQSLPGASSLASLSQNVTVNVYDHAAGSISGGTLTIPPVIVGYPSPVSSNTLTVSNIAASPGGALATTGSASLGNVTLNNVSNVAASGTGSLSATLAAGEGVGAFTQSNVTLTYADASTYSGALANVGSAAVTITGNVYGHASGSAAGTTIGLPMVHAGYTGSLLGTTSASVFNAAGNLVNLKTTGTTTAGNLSINNVGNVAPGGSALIGATLATGRGYGTINQTFNLGYADDSNLPGASSNLDSLSITVTGTVYSGQAQWNVPGPGNWSGNGNWSDIHGGGATGSPGDQGYAGDTATFGNAIGSSSVAITLDSPVTVAAMTFNNSGTGAYAIQRPRDEQADLEQFGQRGHDRCYQSQQ